MSSKQGSKTIELIIGNFFSYTEAGSCVKFPYFRFYNHLFDIKVFPNGEAKESQKFVSLFLYKNGKFPLAKTIELTCGLKSMLKETVKTCKGIWEPDEYPARGFAKFLTRSELLAEKDMLVPSGNLTVIVTCSIHVADRVADSVPNSVPDTYGSINNLTTNFKDMFIAKKNTDVTIKVKEETFSAHRCILAARSPVLAAMFDNEMTEKKTGFVDISDCDPEAFRHFLLYLYSGELDSEKIDYFLLYKIADKYDVTELKLVCVDFLIHNLSLENLCETYILAHQFIELKLLTIVPEFFKENFGKIVSADIFLSLMKEDCDLANTLLKASKVGLNIDF